MVAMPSMLTAPAPLFRDPVYDGAADPVLVYNRGEQQWWMIYTNRRATAPGTGYGWLHGTDLGVASSADGGITWDYRGTLQGLDFEWGHNTFWAPEIIFHEGSYHMYVSYIRGIPTGLRHPRSIHHYTSEDLINWQHHGALPLASASVIDACVFRLPDGRFRLWYKDEAAGSITAAAESADLFSWKDIGPVIPGRAHEGPNVFEFGGFYWLIVDEWRGFAVYRSNDLDNWTFTGHILDRPGTRPDDGGIGLHGDVVVEGNRAFVFYFTHPDRTPGKPELTSVERRTSIQVAELTVSDGALHCDRDCAPAYRLGVPAAGTL